MLIKKTIVLQLPPEEHDRLERFHGYLKDRNEPLTVLVNEFLTRVMDRREWKYDTSKS